VIWLELAYWRVCAVRENEMRRLSLIAVMLALVAPVIAQENIEFEALTVAASATGITDSVVNPAGYPQNNYCTARLATAQVRYRYDGTAPSATVGTVMDVGDVLVISGNDIARTIQWFRTGSTSGVLSITCEIFTP